MVSEKLSKILKKQHYRIVGNHSSVQVCRWTKKDILDQGECYKAKFYGIKSNRCLQMSPATVFCQNMCLHCWRAIEHTDGKSMDIKKVDDPNEIIKMSIEAQKGLLTGFKGNDKANKKKLLEAEEPTQFAISLTGEPTLYPRLGEMIKILRKDKKTSFVVTNGLEPKALKKLAKEDALPTQLYVSMNAPNKEIYDKWHRSTVKDAWKRFNETLKLFPKLNTRKVIRMTLVKGKNMDKKYIKDYVKLIKRADPDFIEAKGFMSVGFARDRKGMGYDSMPRYEGVKEFSEGLVKELGKPYKILSEHKSSAVILIGKDKKRMKIRKSEI